MTGTEKECFKVKTLKMARWGVLGTAAFLAITTLSGQAPAPPAQSPEELIQQLSKKVEASDARIADLEKRMGAQPAPAAATPVANPAQSGAAVAPPAPAPFDLPNQPGTTDSGLMSNAAHDHMMQVLGGPELHFRGFFDFDFDTGSVAQNLQYPLGVPATSSFRTGEFDLFVTSQLSESLSFLSEMVFSTDPTNNFEVDLERYELTYRPIKYFEISAGRYHTSIGYYNTAYHHGTWFSTATGRPFMDYFEDSGGVLPVHEVGVTSTGYLPGSGKFNLHWVAEIGNGRADAGALFGDGVESFASDRNHKDVNFALYSRPEWLPGLQIGGSYLMGDLAPIGLPKVNQRISSAYVVFINSKWEFLNEAVLMEHQVTGGGRSYNSPMGYTQLAYHIGKYRPYFRFQEVNVPNNDPVSAFTGRYEGPSVGTRWDFSDYAALKIQYNRVYLRNAATQNGLEVALAFTF